MKKLLFFSVLLLFSFNIILAQQFEGVIEIKMTKSDEKMDKNEMRNIKNDAMNQALQSIKEEIKKKEDDLKSKSKENEEFKSLKEEIKVLKEQLKSMGSNTEKSNEPTTEVLKFYLKNNRYRVESASQSEMGGSFILNMQKKNIILLMEKDKQYSEIPFSFFKEVMKTMKGMGLKEPEVKKEEKKESRKIKVTGEKKTILGYPCEKWIILDEETTSEAWLTLKFTNLFSAFLELGEEFMGEGATQSGGFNDEFMNAMGDKGAFPLAVTEKNKEGKIIEQWDVLKIDKKTVTDDTFQAPKGYEKFDMMQMFQGK